MKRKLSLLFIMLALVSQACSQLDAADPKSPQIKGIKWPLRDSLKAVFQDLRGNLVTLQGNKLVIYDRENLLNGDTLRPISSYDGLLDIWREPVSGIDFNPRTGIFWVNSTMRGRFLFLKPSYEISGSTVMSDQFARINGGSFLDSGAGLLPFIVYGSRLSNRTAVNLWMVGKDSLYALPIAMELAEVTHAVGNFEKLTAFADASHKKIIIKGGTKDETYDVQWGIRQMGWINDVLVVRGDIGFTLISPSGTVSHHGSERYNAMVLAGGKIYLSVNNIIDVYNASGASIVGKELEGVSSIKVVAAIDNGKLIIASLGLEAAILDAEALASMNKTGINGPGN